jgi:hypothetical protein
MDSSVDRAGLSGPDPGTEKLNIKKPFDEWLFLMLRDKNQLTF